MITYEVDKPISAEQVMEIVASFPQYYWRTKEKTEKAIDASICNIAAYDDEKLIGVILAGTPDHAYFIYVHSLMVAPNYQHVGVGRTLVERMLEKCLQMDYMDIVCFAAPGAKEFLEGFGFVKDLGNVQGMILKREG